MKGLVLLLAGLALASAAAPKDEPVQAGAGQCVAPGADPPLPTNAPPNATFLTSVAPPLRFRGNTGIRVEFRSAEEVNRICAGGKPVCGRVFYACHHGDCIYMPNPCGFPMTEPYAKLLCHEIAHGNGWPAYHGE